MNQKVEIERMQAAFKRAAEKATRGTREERSGRFELRDEARLPAVLGEGGPVSAILQNWILSKSDQPSELRSRSRQSEIDRQLTIAFSEIERSLLMPDDFNGSVKLMIKHSMLGLV
jgi:hypothetical protein